MIENKKDRPLPYTTRTGLKIGWCYIPDTRPQLSHEEEVIQSVMLGIDPFDRKFKFWFVTYCVVLAFLFSLMIILKDGATCLDLRGM